jgi:hypothetical protein
MVCPRCDDQGLIYKIKVLNLDIKLYICDECDACWLEDQEVSITAFKDLTVFLEEHGLTYEDSEIEDLGYVDSNDKKRNRTFFNVPSNEIIALIDEAWLTKGNHLVNDPGTYVVNMRRIIGTNGESAIKIIVKPGTAEIKTAYPVSFRN